MPSKRLSLVSGQVALLLNFTGIHWAHSHIILDLFILFPLQRWGHSAAEHPLHRVREGASAHNCVSCTWS